MIQSVVFLASGLSGAPGVVLWRFVPAGVVIFACTIGTLLVGNASPVRVLCPPRWRW
jgi:hypothetical protein